MPMVMEQDLLIWEDQFFGTRDVLDHPSTGGYPFHLYNSKYKIQTRISYVQGLNLLDLARARLWFFK